MQVVSDSSNNPALIAGISSSTRIPAAALTTTPMPTGVPMT